MPFCSTISPLIATGNVGKNPPARTCEISGDTANSLDAHPQDNKPQTNHLIPLHNTFKLPPHPLILKLCWYYELCLFWVLWQVCWHRTSQLWTRRRLCVSATRTQSRLILRHYRETTSSPPSSSHWSPSSQKCRTKLSTLTTRRFRELSHRSSHK